MVARPLVVAVVPIAPSTRGNGLAMRAARLVAGLAREHDVLAVVLPVAGTLDPVLAAPPGADHLRTLEVPVPGPGRRGEHQRAELLDARLRERLRRVLPLPSALPVLSPAMAADVLAALPAGAVPAQVWAMRSAVAPVGRELARHWGVPLAVDLDDDDVGLLERTGSAEDARAVDRLLREDVAPAALVVAAGPAPAAALAARLGRPVEVVPNGVDVPPDPGPAPRSRILVFVANFTYAPNAESARWLAGHVLGRHRLSTAVEVHLVGPGAAGTGAALPAGSPHRLVAVGPVADLWAEYRGAEMALAPILEGGGTSTKVLEAAAHRRAVVATSVAARDLGLHDGAHLRVADSPEAFASSLRDLLADPDTADRLANAARHQVASAHTTDHAAGVVAGLAANLNRD